MTSTVRQFQLRAEDRAPTTPISDEDVDEPAKLNPFIYTT